MWSQISTGRDSQLGCLDVDIEIFLESDTQFEPRFDLKRIRRLSRRLDSETDPTVESVEVIRFKLAVLLYAALFGSSLVDRSAEIKTRASSRCYPITCFWQLSLQVAFYALKNTKKKRNMFLIYGD